VLTEPAPGADAAGKPGVLLLNSGILHRVGSCRMHVRLARALSDQGFTSLRFDYSGIGDSEQRKDSLSFEESAVVETREAMDYLAGARRLDRFLVFGLCSGADMAHETALADQRIVGLAMLDAWCYRNLGWYLHHYGPKVFNLSRWRHAIHMRLRKLLGTGTHAGGQRAGMAGVEYEVPKYVRVFPPRKKVEQDLTAFMARGMSLYFAWTGGLVEYNHRNQYRRTFRNVQFRDLLTVDYLPDADHILSGLQHQDFVADRVVAWAGAAAARTQARPRTAASNAA
jgi:hypothetical protein